MKPQKDYHVVNYHSQSGRYDHEEGFSDEEKEPEIIISYNEASYDSVNILEKKKIRTRIQEPKVKLKYILNQQATRVSLHNSIADKQFQNRSIVSKSLQFHKKQPANRSSVLIHPIFRSKRTLIGQNFTIPPYALQDFRALKQSLLAQGHQVIFQGGRQASTHGQLKKITQSKVSGSFLLNRFNTLIKERLKDSFVLPKKPQQNSNSQSRLSFNPDVESGNLELVTQFNDSQYDLYLRIDTNTHGHQNWFHFEVTNHKEMGNFIFNICNLRRDFRLIEKGQKIFIKQHKKDQKWQPAGANISIIQNTHQKIYQGRIYKLTFTLNLKEDTKYSIAMLPAYTYSNMLTFIDQLEELNRKYVEISLLGYSLTGLAIPIATITNKEVKNEGKKVVLISSRIHPGETVSSIVVEGLMRKLVDQSNKQIMEMLKTTVFKIIPMINPDGVVFGNFRTNYLGVDLNRAFHSDDEVLNPEIWALKSLGRELKSQFGGNFALFIDLHGHSSQKNIFSYGPNFQYNDPSFYIARLLPKILNMKSKYFKYASCTFKLQQHKLHTARGFFLNELSVMTYTIESTYSMYDDLDDTTKLMKVDDWLNFGMELAEGIESYFKIKQANSIRSNKQLRNILNSSENQDVQLIKKIKSEVKKQIKGKLKDEPKIGYQYSDGQSSCEDLTQQERKQAEKKILQFNFPLSLPKVLKPAILYPTVTPRLFEVNQEKDEGNFKILYTKRNKYNTLRMMNANSMYANYLKNLDQLEKFKPCARNIKLEKKFQL